MESVIYTQVLWIIVISWIILRVTNLYLSVTKVLGNEEIQRFPRSELYQHLVQVLALFLDYTLKAVPKFGCKFCGYPLDSHLGKSILLTYSDILVLVYHNS